MYKTSRTKNQRGVTLIVALVMLVVIGLTSAAVMRGAMSSDRVANNTRVQALAQQAAQIALRYCEHQLELTGGAQVITIHAAAATEADQKWLDFDNWHGAGAIADVVPDSLLASPNSAFVPATKPQCIVEKSTVAGTVAYIVTTRGFSPDYAEDNAGNATAGSVVWLQSTVRL